MTEHGSRSFDLAALDMAGTTVEEHGAVYATLRAAVEDHLREQIPDPVLARWTGTSKHEAVAGLLTELRGPTAPAVVDSVYGDFSERLAARYAEQPPTAIAGATESIAVLREAGVKVVLQTGYSRDIATSILTGLGWAVGRHVDGLVSSDEVAASRPAPYLIFHAMELVGVRATRRVLVAGDTPNDLGAGDNAGAGFVVGVLTGAHGRDELARHPHTHLLDGVGDLPGLL